MVKNKADIRKAKLNSMALRAVAGVFISRGFHQIGKFDFKGLLEKWASRRYLILSYDKRRHPPTHLLVQLGGT